MFRITYDTPKHALLHLAPLLLLLRREEEDLSKQRGNHRSL